MLKNKNWLGLRTVNTDGHSSDASSGQRDRSRVHVRNAKTAAHDNVRGG